VQHAHAAGQSDEIQANVPVVSQLYVQALTPPMIVSSSTRRNPSRRPSAALQEAVLDQGFGVLAVP